MQKLVFLALACFAHACGAPDEGLDDEMEFAQNEQPYSASVTVGFQFGTRTSASRQRCDRANTTQVCSIPSFASTVKWCIDSLLSANSRSRITSGISKLDLALSNWTFSENLDLFGGCDPTGAQVVFIKSAVGASGSGSGDVNDYVRADFSGVTALTENGVIGEPAVVGQYQKHNQCTVRVDEVDILAKGTSATQDNNGIDHASLHGLLECLGIGGREAVPASRASRNLFDLTTIATTIKGSEICVLNAFNNSNNGNYANIGNCGSD